jgi:hypothetical protein
MGKTYRRHYLLASLGYDEDMPNYMKKTNFSECKKHGKNLIVKNRFKLNKLNTDFDSSEFTPSTIKNSVKQIVTKNITENYHDFDVTVDDLKMNGLLLKNFVNPTMNECMIALKQNPDALIYVKNPNEQIYMEAVKRKGLVLQYISNPSEKVCFTALNQNPLALQFIVNQTDEMIKFAIKKSPFATTMIKKPSKELYYILIKENVNSYMYMDLAYTDDTFIDIALESLINKNGMMLEKFFKIQTFKLCEIAIEQNPNAIMYVNYALFTTKQVNQLCKSAIIKNPMVLQYITKAHNNNVIKINIGELSKLALQLNGMSLKYLCDCQQRYDWIKIAINNNPNAYEYIKDMYFKFIFNESAYIKLENKIDDCAVCYSSETHFVKYFKCNHLFCRDCIYNTDDIQACPLCRERRVRKVPGLYMN